MKILEGDCVEVMRGMDDESVDAIVTDPPYGLGFMGKAWDDLPPGLKWAQECLRVLKPGGHLLAFGGSRTYHRLAVAVEDAGFEVRDQMMWLYGSGFPKSLDVSKAIDKAAGAEQNNVYETKQGVTTNIAYGKGLGVRLIQRNAATADAKKWSGWGTALKPAHEPIVVARKPLVGTVAENVLRFGTGALNVDGCRIGEPDGFGGGSKGTSGFAAGYASDGFVASTAGRWPANLILDEEAGRLLDEQSGERPTGAITPYRSSSEGGYEGGWGTTRDFTQPASTGGASRFFYCAKAGKAERNAGLDGFEEGKRPLSISQWKGQTNGSGNQMGASTPQRNTHPTVKPISLMAYLVRLVTPPNGTVLDPFLGSGTTGCAAALEGFDFIGIEREPDYIAIAEARIAWWEKHKGDAEVSDILAAGKDRDEVEDAGQLDLLGDAA